MTIATENGTSVLIQPRSIYREGNGVPRIEENVATQLAIRHGHRLRHYIDRESMVGRKERCRMSSVEALNIERD